MKMKKVSSKILALVMACAMLFSISAPALAAGVSHQHEDTDINYVSIGDSMTNGYGFDGYNQGNKDDLNGNGNYTDEYNFYEDYNVYGEGSYALQFEEYLKGLGFNVDHTKLASSALRAEDLLYLLGGREMPTDGWFEQVLYYTDAGENGKWGDDTTPEAIAKLSGYYQSAVKDADIITLCIGNASFGAYLLSRVSGVLMGGDLSDSDYQVDLEDALSLLESEDAKEIVLTVYNQLKAEMAPYFSVVNGFEPERLEAALGIFAYTVAGFLINYEGVIDAIVEMNPDVEIMLIGLMNTTYGMNVTGDGFSFAFGDMMDEMFGILNAYIAGLPTVKQLAGECEDVKFYYAAQPAPEFIVQAFDDLAADGWNNIDCGDKNCEACTDGDPDTACPNGRLSGAVVRSRQIDAYNSELREMIGWALGFDLPNVSPAELKAYEKALKVYGAAMAANDQYLVTVRFMEQSGKFADEFGEDYVVKFIIDSVGGDSSQLTAANKAAWAAMAPSYGLDAVSMFVFMCCGGTQDEATMEKVGAAGAKTQDEWTALAAQKYVADNGMDLVKRALVNFDWNPNRLGEVVGQFSDDDFFGPDIEKEISMAIYLAIEDSIAMNVDTLDITVDGLMGIATGNVFEALGDMPAELSGAPGPLTIRAALRGWFNKTETGRAMVKVYALFKVGDGMSVHPTPAGHDGLFKAIVEAYEGNYTAQDETLKNLAILGEFIEEYYDEAYEIAYNEALKAGVIDEINAYLDEVQNTVNDAEAWVAQYSEYLRSPEFAVKLAESFATSRVTIEEVRALINTADKLDAESYAQLLTLLEALTVNVKTIGELLTAGVVDADEYIDGVVAELTAQAEITIAELTAKAQAEISALMAEAKATIDALRAEAEAKITALMAETEAKIEALKAEAAARINALIAEAEAAIEALKAEAKATADALQAQAQAEINALIAAAEAKIAELQAQAEAQLAILYDQLKNSTGDAVNAILAEIARVEAELEAAIAAIEAKLAADIANIQATVAGAIAKVEADLAAAIAAVNAALDAAIANANAELAAAIAAAKAAYDAAIESLNAELKAAIAAVEAKVAAKIAEIEAKLAEAIAAVEAELAAAIETAKKNIETAIAEIKTQALTKIAALRAEAAAKIDALKAKVAAEIAALKAAAEAKIDAFIAQVEAKVEALRAEAEATITALIAEAKAKVEALKAEAKATVDALRAEAEAKITELQAQAEAKIAELQAQAQAQLAALRAQLETAVGEAREAILAEIARVEAELEAAVAKVQAELTAAIAQINAEIEATIAAIEAKLAADIAAIKATVEATVAQVKAELANAIAKAEAEAEAAIAAVKAKLAEDIAKAEAALEAAIATVKAELACAIAKVEAEANAAIAEAQKTVSAALKALNGILASVNGATVDALRGIVNAIEGIVSEANATVSGLVNALNKLFDIDYSITIDYAAIEELIKAVRKYIATIVVGEIELTEDTFYLAIVDSDYIYADIVAEALNLGADQYKKVSITEVTVADIARADLITVAYSGESAFDYAVSQTLGAVSVYADTALRASLNAYIADAFTGILSTAGIAQISTALNGAIDGVLATYLAGAKVDTLDWVGLVGEENLPYIYELEAAISDAIIDAGVPATVSYTVDVVDLLYTNADSLGMSDFVGLIEQDYLYSQLGENALYTVEIPVAQVLNVAVSSALYEYISYNLTYAKTMQTIVAVNPDATVSALGNYNRYNLDYEFFVDEVEFTLADVIGAYGYTAGAVMPNELTTALNALPTALLAEVTVAYGSDINAVINKVITLGGENVNVNDVFGLIAAISSLNPLYYAAEYDNVIYVDIAGAGVGGDEYIAAKILGSLIVKCEHTYSHCEDATCDICGDVRVPGEHSFTNYIYNGDATCTANGTKTATCDNGCGVTDTVEAEGTILAHTFTNYVSDGNATCEEDGTKTATCDDGCGATDTVVDEGSALGHSFTNYVSNGDATCEEDGTKTATCDNGCGKVDTVIDEGSIKGHVFTNYVSNNDATCEKDGTKTATCDRGCGATNIIADENTATGHSFTNYVSDGNATCEANGTKTATCDNGCGKVDTVIDEGSIKGHAFTNYVSNNDATCTTDGTKTAACDNGCGKFDTVVDTGSALGHSYTNYVSNGDATCTTDGTKTAICDNGCGTEDTKVDTGSALGHSYTNYVSNGDATCTTDGTKTAICDNGCGTEDTKVDTGSVLGHSFTNYVSNGDATCTTDGTKTAECDNGCGKKDTVIDTGSKKGHTEVTVPGTPATCTTAGLTDGKKCSVCNTVTVAQEPILAIGHSFTNYVSNGDATCTTDGTKTAICDNEGCDAEDTKVDTGSKKNHSFTNYVSNNNATCTQDGTKTATCDNGCGNADTVTDTGSKKTHVFTNYVPNGDATCTEDGTKTAICNYGCGETDTVTDTGSKKGHSYTNYVSNGDATCTEDGTKTAICNYGCGETDTVTDTGSKKGHSYTNYVSNGDATCTEDGTKTATCDRGCGETDTVTDTGSALGHDYDNGVVTTAPTYTAEGVKTYTCSVCGGTYTEAIDMLVKVDEIVSPDNSGIKVTVPEGSSAILNENTVINVNKITGEVTDSVKDNIKNAIGKGKTTVLASYDISLLLDGATVQPGGKVAFTLPAPENGGDFDSLVVVYIDDNGNASTCDTTVNADGSVTFLTDHFSQYSIVGVNNSTSTVIAVIAAATVVLAVIGAGVYVFIKKKRFF